MSNQRLSRAVDQSDWGRKGDSHNSQARENWYPGPPAPHSAQDYRRLRLPRPESGRCADAAFDDNGDYLAFVKELGQGLEEYADARLLSFCRSKWRPCVTALPKAGRMARPRGFNESHIVWASQLPCATEADRRRRINYDCPFFSPRGSIFLSL